MKLSAVILKYRDEMKISQREFARRCGLSNSYISFIENEVNPKTGKPMVPTLEQYQKIASGMNMTVQQLFDLLDDEAPVDLHKPAPVDSVIPKNDEITLLIPGSSKLPPERIAFIKSAFLATLKATNPELFEGDDDQ